MKMAATLLLALTIPLLLVANAALQDTYRLHGPDIIEPAAFFLGATVLRWLLALLAICLITGSRSLDASMRGRPLQVVVMVAAFAIAEWAAGISAAACAPKDTTAGPELLVVGKFLSLAVPIALGLMLMPAIQGNLSCRTTRAILITIMAVSFGMLPTYYHVGHANDLKNQAEIQAYYGRQRKLAAKGLVDLQAIPVNCPLEDLIPYTVYPWPPDVMNEVDRRIQKRPGFPDELLTMIADDSRRPAAIQYLRRDSTNYPGFNAKLCNAFLQLADAWKSRFPNLSDKQSALLVSDCQGILDIAYWRETAANDFLPTISAWREVMSAAPQTQAIVDARTNLEQRYKFYARPTTAAMQPAVAQ